MDKASDFGSEDCRRILAANEDLLEGNSSSAAAAAAAIGDEDAVEATAKIVVRTSGAHVRPKEAILICLALSLLVFSVSLFLKNWKKNYWDINHLPYYTQHCYERAGATSAMGTTTTVPQSPAAMIPQSPGSHILPGASQIPGSHVGFIATSPSTAAASTAALPPPLSAGLSSLGPEQPPKLFDVACSLSRSHSARYSYGRNCPNFSLSLGGVGRCQSAHGGGVNGNGGRRQRAASRLAATRKTMAANRTASDFDSPSASIDSGNGLALPYQPNYDRSSSMRATFHHSRRPTAANQSRTARAATTTTQLMPLPPSPPSVQVAPQLSFETTRSDPSPRVEEHDDDDDDDVRRGDLHHEEQGELRIVISRTVSSDAEEDNNAHAHSPKSPRSVKCDSAESGLHLKMDSF